MAGQRATRAIAVMGVVWILVVGGAATSSGATIAVLNDNGNLVFDFGAPGELEFDIDWLNQRPVWLEVTLQDSGPLVLSGFHRNLTFVPWGNFHIALDGGPVFGEVNRIDPVPIATTGGVGMPEVELAFSPAIPVLDFLELGEPNGLVDPGVDWLIDTGGLMAGDTFSIHLQPVPEPVTVLLLGLGLAGVRAVRRRRASSAPDISSAR